MDRERFDTLAKLLATKGSRRSALGALFSVAILGHDPDDADAKNGKKGRGKRNANRDKNRNRNQRNARDTAGSDAERDQPVDVAAEEAAAPEIDAPDVQVEAVPGDGKRKNRGRGKGKGRGKNQRRKRDGQVRAQALPAKCCASGDCTPGSGKNLGKCCYEGQNLANRNFNGANLGNATFRGAILTNANFSNANLDKTCFVDANLTGVKWGGANTGTAIFCRTTMPDGATNNGGCTKGTPCCPTCDEENTCPNADQICCNGKCVTGACCTAGDCEDRECQNKTCTGNRCRYTPVTNGPGPLCDTTCCNGVCNETGAACLCTATSCQTGCCSNGPGNAGTCQQSDHDSCGINGVLCRNCATNPAAPVCSGRQCICPPARVVCNNVCCAQGEVCDTRPDPDTCCSPQSDSVTCGVGSANPKCGNVANNCGQEVNCGGCPMGQTCVGNRCVCNATSCPAGCCSNGPDNPGTCTPSSNTTCGISGAQCTACPSGTNCNADGRCVCDAQSCPQGCCAGVCCTSPQVCNMTTDPDTCCTPQPIDTICAGRCGTVNNCGQPVTCPECPPQTCKTATCGTTPPNQNICVYANTTNDVFGPGCGTRCCDGACCTDSAQVCLGSPPTCQACSADNQCEPTGNICFFGSCRCGQRTPCTDGRVCMGSGCCFPGGFPIGGGTSLDSRCCSGSKNNGICRP